MLLHISWTTFVKIGGIVSGCTAAQNSFSHDMTRTRLHFHMMAHLEGLNKFNNHIAKIQHNYFAKPFFVATKRQGDQTIIQMEWRANKFW